MRGKEMSLLVSDLFNMNIFQGCELVTAIETGENRPIIDIAIYDYEFLCSKDESFQEGDFVISTFLYASESKASFEKGIKTLVHRNVACIGIKNVYFKKLPQELVEYCNKYNIPVFFFDEDIFFETIIYNVKKALDYDKKFQKYTHVLEDMLNFNKSSLYDIQVNKLEVRILEKYLSIFINSINISVNNAERYIHSDLIGNIVFMNYYRQGLFIIFSFKNGEEELFKKLLNGMFRDLVNKLNCYIGVSHTYDNINSIIASFKESYFASNLFSIVKKSIIYYEHLGYYKIFLNSLNDKSINRFYHDTILTIKDYDRKNNTILFETLYEMVECNHDITKVAENLFQHPNTIRYRIKRIHSLFFHESNKQEFNNQINYLVNLYKLKRIM